MSLAQRNRDRATGVRHQLTDDAREYQDGGLRAETKLYGGDLIARLYSLRQYMVGYWDFDAMARTYGKRVLRERYDDLTDAALDELVSWPLDLLAKVVRSQMN